MLSVRYSILMFRLPDTLLLSHELFMPWTLTLFRKQNYMQINEEDRVTLIIIFNELIHLENIQELDSIIVSLEMLLEGNVGEHEDLISFLNQFVRTPLYNFYWSDECKKNLDNVARQNIFSFLMMLALFWPINSNCCITNTPEIVDKKNRFYFLSGHVADINAVLKYINKNPTLPHPLLDKKISFHEVLYFFNYFPTIMSSECRELFQDSVRLAINPFMLAGTFLLAALVAGLAVLAVTSVITGIFPALGLVVFGSESIFPFLAVAISVCAAAYTTYKLKENLSETLTKAHLANEEVVLRKCYKAENSLTTSLIRVANTLRSDALSKKAQSITKDASILVEEKQPNTPAPLPIASPSGTGKQSPLQANSLLRRSASMNDDKLEQKEGTALEQEGQAVGGPKI